MIKLDEPIPLRAGGNDLLTVGELLVDMISSEYGDAAGSDTFHKYFGGSPSNIAMNVKRLGIRSLVASAVGRDGFGTFLLDRLQAAGIDTCCIQQVEEATSMVVVTKSRGTPLPVFYRKADYRLAYLPELEQALEQSKIVHFSCWPLSRMPARETVERVMDEAKERRLLIGFDPNYHPMIWQKGEDGIGYVKSVIGRADIVKPSEDDAERLFGKDLPHRQLEKFISLGARLVIMTLGKDGAIVSDGECYAELPSLATEVVDTTGAGDAFWSGFYTAVVKGRTVREALGFGSAVSAYKLKQAGAVVELPALEDIGRMYDLKEV